MKVIRIIALMIALAGIQAGLILVDFLPPLSINSSGNALFILARIVIFGYTGWIFSGISFKEAAKKGGIVALASVITIYVGLFIGMTVNIPVLGMNYASPLDLIVILLFLGVINVIIGAGFAVIGAIIGRKFIK